MSGTATESPFRPSKRTTGVSDTEIILNMPDITVPGTRISYQQVIDALNGDCEREHTIQEAQSAVCRANHVLLSRHKRCLRNVPNFGYRVIEANEHASVARHRVKKSSRQARWAMRTMEHTNLDDMSPDDRIRHEAQMAINRDLYSETRRQARKQKETERLLRNLTKRVEDLEQRDQAG